MGGELQWFPFDTYSGVVKLVFVLLACYLSTVPLSCIFDMMTMFRRLHSYELGTASKHSDYIYMGRGMSLRASALPIFLYVLLSS